MTFSGLNPMHFCFAQVLLLIASLSLARLALALNSALLADFSDWLFGLGTVAMLGAFLYWLDLQ